MEIWGYKRKINWVKRKEKILVQKCNQKIMKKLGKILEKSRVQIKEKNT